MNVPSSLEWAREHTFRPSFREAAFLSVMRGPFDAFRQEIIKHSAVVPLGESKTRVVRRSSAKTKLACSPLHTHPPGPERVSLQAASGPAMARKLLFCALLGLSSSSAMDSYIVFYRKGVPAEERWRIENSVQDAGGQITALYKSIGGFAARLRPEHVSALQEDPAIQFIEHDGEVHAVRPVEEIHPTAQLEVQ